MSSEPKTETGAIATTEAPKESTTAQFAAALGEVLESTGYNEMWGVTLKDGEDVPTSIVLTKFLRANDGDVSAAKKQLTSALEWRKKMKPLELIKGSYSDEKFGGLGYVTTHKDEAGKETIISWNIYGAVKDNKKTFGDVEEFIKWRAALMELSVQKLNLSAATERIPEDGDDQYQMIQVHDYLSVSFFRPDPNVKKASQEAIRVFSLAYPELLSHKYFVNVPTIMGWMYGLMKLFVAPATLKKFHPMSSGTTLGTELPAIKATLPPAYGGQGPDVKTAGETVGLVQEPAATEKTEPTPAASADVPAPVTTAAEETTAPATATADETKLAESTTVGAKSVEAPKPAEQPNPLGSSPVTVAADAQPVKEVKPVEEPKAGVPVETVAPAVVENSATEETKTEAKAEEVVEKK